MQNKFHREIIQIPSEANGNTAITQLTVSNGETSYSDFGVATPQMIDGNTDTNALLKKSKDIAMQSIQALPRQLEALSSKPSSIPAHSFQVDYQKPQSQNKNYNHNPNKLMSSNQKNAIEGMVNRQNIDIESLSREITGKSFSDASSADANDIINRLKSR